MYRTAGCSLYGANRALTVSEQDSLVIPEFLIARRSATGSEMPRVAAALRRAEKPVKRGTIFLIVFVKFR